MVPHHLGSNRWADEVELEDGELNDDLFWACKIFQLGQKLIHLQTSEVWHRLFPVSWVLNMGDWPGTVRPSGALLYLASGRTSLSHRRPWESKRLAPRFTKLGHQRNPTELLCNRS
ncbi:hypothetical protein M6B38_411365 [Iris pallida]|uniref:Uncharacterized protein n=1 Tax=Iris pallida TaxID=29817 RepID=A0AAX6FM35_IRIPA|nr:hypothetical protein M6B38_411365 [Iris pallida]